MKRVTLISLFLSFSLSLSLSHIHTQQVKAIADAGCNVVVSGGKFGEIALHFLNKYKIMAIR